MRKGLAAIKSLSRGPLGIGHNADRVMTNGGTARNHSGIKSFYCELVAQSFSENTNTRTNKCLRRG